MKVVDARFVPNSDRIVTGSDDYTCRIFSPSGGRDHFKSTKILQYHKSGGVNGINVHPCGSYMVSTANDKTMGFWDLEKGEILCDVLLPKNCAMPSFSSKWYAAKYGSWRFHCTVRCQVKRRNCCPNIRWPQCWNFVCRIFPIGTHVASGDTDGVVKIWDLRKKTNQNLVTLQL